MADAGGGAGSGVMKVLKPELMKIQERWGSQIKITKGGKGAPLPLVVQRTIPQTAAAEAYDVNDLTVRFIIEGVDPAEAPVKVEVLPVGIPVELSTKIAEGVGIKWSSMLKHPKAKGKGWLIEKMLSWVEKEFVTLLRLIPEIIEAYSMEGEGGDSTRRFMITIEDEADEETEDEKYEREMQLALDNAKWLEIQAMQEELAAEDAGVLAEQKRAEAESGILMNGAKPVQLSKKDEAKRLDAKRNKQGLRTAKTGSRAKKFDAAEEDKLKNMPGYDSKGKPTHKIREYKANAGHSAR